MTNNNTGISAETVENVSQEIWKSQYDDIERVPTKYRDMANSAINALLASGEVVLRKDVEELVYHADHLCGNYRSQEDKIYNVGIKRRHLLNLQEALAKLASKEAK